MAASGRNSRRKYSSPNAVNGNLARKLDGRELERRLETSGQLDFDKQYRRRKETESEQRARQRAAVKAAVRPAQKLSLAAVAGFASVAGLMFVLLLCYIKMSDISRSITEMKNEISRLETEQVALMAKYEQSFDLSSVKEIAESVGMAQPSESQICYIDLPGSDQAVAYSGGKNDMLGGIEALIREKIQAIKEYFS